MTATPAAGPHATSHGHHQTFWLWVMCLTGVDYFSTLGYQPSIAYEATGLLLPLATVLLVALTLFGAVPVFRHVAGESPHGQGSIAMLERLVRGWTGKTLVLVLLGFAATDFVITKTLSAADAAKHLIENAYWKSQVTTALPPWAADGQQIALTAFLLVLLGATFLRGFREVIGLAVVIVGAYLLLSGVIIGYGLYYLSLHPGLLADWWAKLGQPSDVWHLEHTAVRGTGWLIVLANCVLLFPKLALGLSGFETGVAVMPLIKGDPGDDPHRPAGRIRAARKLLLTAALVMSAFLLGSALVITTLIPPEAFHKPPASDPGAPPPAKERALAYLAHGEGEHKISPLFGEVFGTVYDVVTIVILWFAGASAMAGLLNLVPQYLPRYGMAPAWAQATRPLVLLFTLINLVVTVLFKADVTAQGGAYATGVVVLMTSASVATVVDKWRARSGSWAWRVPWGYVAICAVFVYTTVAILIEKVDGLIIASFFILAIVVSSIVSRAWRSTELRMAGFQFADAGSRFLWDSIKHLEFQVLVPHRPGGRSLPSKEESIRQDHRLAASIPVIFIEVEIGDPSDFWQSPLMEVKQEEGRFILRVTRAASIAHVIAAIALELSKVGKPPEIHFGWSAESPLVANLGFLLLGEGNVPWMVHELIRKAETSPERQPRVMIG